MDDWSRIGGLGQAFDQRELLIRTLSAHLDVSRMTRTADNQFVHAA